MTSSDFAGDRNPAQDLPRDLTQGSAQDLARRIHAASHLTGDFVLRSGRTTTEYFDKYRFEGDPALLDAIARAMVPLVPPATDVLAGLEMGGIPVVTALSHHTGLPCAFVRKHPKPYGTRLLAEGAGIHAALCVIDRQQGGAPALLAEGITLLSLLTATDLNATA